MNKALLTETMLLLARKDQREIAELEAALDRLIARLKEPDDE